MTLEADGAISVYEIETGNVVATYEGLDVHEAMQLAETERQNIDQAALEKAGWECIHWNAHFNGGVLEFWKTTRPKWKTERHYDNSVRVRFGNDGYFPDRPFMVWLGVGESVTPVPNVQTMDELTLLLSLFMDKS